MTISFAAPPTDIVASARGSRDAGASPIASLAGVPAGATRNDLLPRDWRDQFAILHCAALERLYVLTAPDAMGGMAMYELRQRLLRAANGLPKPEFLPATVEIVRMLHARDGNGRVAQEAQVSDVEKLAFDLIEAALAQGASDIHIETRGDHAEVYHRVNGLRALDRTITHETARGITRVLYAVHADAGSKDVTWDPSQVMDAVIEYKPRAGGMSQLRFSSAPIFPSGNFHAVIRLLRMESAALGLDQLGYESAQIAALTRMTTGLSGMVLLCGPTNSGKSTTMQALLRGIYARLGNTVKIITVEDPVEYLVPGACQISVARRRAGAARGTRAGDRDNTYGAFLRGTLRQDPDVVMIGEIRDQESAMVCKDLVLAGRKLLTTLHTHAAIWAFVRLRELGVPSELLTMPGFVSGIVFQRLVPTLCPHCAQTLDSPRGMTRIHGDTRQRVITAAGDALARVRVRGAGCAQCKGTGVSGRSVCAEFVEPDTTLLTLIAQQRYLDAEHHWLGNGGTGLDTRGVTALAHGVRKMREGLVDPVDLEASVGLLSMVGGGGLD